MFGVLGQNSFFVIPGLLIVADAYYGLYRVNVDTGAKEVLVPATLDIAGKKNLVTNSLAITKDGSTVYFTSSRCL